MVQIDKVYCKLDWDTKFFGFNVAKILVKDINENILNHILDKCEEDEIRVLFYLANANSAQSIHLAEAYGFRFVDDKITLNFRFSNDKLHPNTTEVNIRSFKESDIVPLEEIAGVSFIYDRFHFDPNFPKELCDEMRATWIGNMCRGLADEVLVAELENKCAGFISCEILERNSKGEIGLTGVAPFAQRQGIGLALTNTALRWFQDKGVEEVVVSTQSRNIGAQRLYQTAGFKTCGSAIWFHKWFF